MTVGLAVGMTVGVAVGAWEGLYGPAWQPIVNGDIVAEADAIQAKLNKPYNAVTLRLVSTPSTSKLSFASFNPQLPRFLLVRSRSRIEPTVATCDDLDAESDGFFELRTGTVFERSLAPLSAVNLKYDFDQPAVSLLFVARTVM